MIQQLCNLINTNNPSSVPEALDVWIHYSEQTTSVLWKVRAVGFGTTLALCGCSQINKNDPF